MWLTTHGGWLLIWDNLEDLTLLDRFLPPTRQGALLLTTRCQTLGTLAEALDLMPMEPQEGLLFLARRAKLLAPTGTLKDARQWAVQRPAQYQAAASLVTETGALDVVFPEMLVKTAYPVWKQCERLLPHALACLRWAGTAEDPLVVASLAHKAAQYLRVRGRYAEAEPILQRALHLREQVLGGQHPGVATSLNYLAILYGTQGKYTEAEPLFQRALHLWEQALGPDHPHVAEALQGLAKLFQQHGQAAAAEPFYRRALAIREARLGPHHPEAAHTLHELALLRQQQGQMNEARSLAERALSIRVQSLGAAHPKTSATQALYAHLLQHPGCQEEKESGADRPTAQRPCSPRATHQPAGSGSRGAPPLRLVIHQNRASLSPPPRLCLGAALQEQRRTQRDLRRVRKPTPRSWSDAHSTPCVLPCGESLRRLPTRGRCACVP